MCSKDPDMIRELHIFTTVATLLWNATVPAGPMTAVFQFAAVIIAQCVPVITAA